MRILGPIFRFELFRIARRQRLTSSRCLFALALAGVAAAVYIAAYKESPLPLTLHQIANITEGLCYGFLGILFAVAVIFTPQWTADAIASEKERRTLPFLLLTDLTSHEIILGKLASRLVQIGFFVLAALPVLVGLQFFGGVEPTLVLVAVAALGATMWSLGSLTMVASVYARTSRIAAQRAGQVFGLYIVGMMMLGQLLNAFPSIGHWPGTRFDLLDLHEWLNIANPLAAIQTISSAIRGTFAQTLWPVFWGYFLAHLGLGAAFAAWAIARLRPVAAAAPLDGPPPEIVQSDPLQRPPIRDWPVFWKMLWCDSRTIKSRWNRTVVRFTYSVGLVFFPGLIGIVAYNGGGWLGIPEIANVYIRMVGTMVLCGMLLFIAGLAASSIGRERQKQTLDELLLTDLSTDEILKQKWWASIWCLRWMMLWMVIHWAIAISVGGLDPWAAGAVAVLWLGYAAFVASLGLYFSVRTWTPQRAHFWTTMVGIIVAVAPLSLAMMAMWITRWTPTWQFGIMMLSPPAALGTSAFANFPEKTIARSSVVEWRFLVAGICLSFVLHLLLAVWFWVRAKRIFPTMISRS
jgi:ABC-type Na+ efflux pump permease subunit